MKAPLLSEFTFKDEHQAREAWTELDRYGRQRNNQNTVAFREGLRVFIRPEFISTDLMRELGSLSTAF